MNYHDFFRLNESADDFDLLIGARGSSSALLLGTVFLRDEMLPIVPASAWANIREAQTAKSSIRWAAPVAFGDRTPSGRTIVGTTRSFLDPKSRSKPSRYSSENDVLIEKSVKYTDFFLLSIVYV